MIRPKGPALSLAVRPLTLFLALLLGGLTLAAALAAGLYLELYPRHQELVAAHQETVRELTSLRNLYDYQYAVADDYARLLGAVARPDPAEGGETTAPAQDFIPQAAWPTPLDPAPPIADPSGRTLESWSDLLPNPASPPEQELDIEQLHAAGPDFSFQLTNTGLGQQAQGRLLLLFAVQTGGQGLLAPYPDFDDQSPTPDFSQGLGYNIRSSKIIKGRLNLPADGQIVAMTAVAFTRGGQVVLKKKIAPL
ncbi:MAG: hypothetical protein LBP55_06485 [Candidatus Adiutrix sp.]|nr:hypothetical protein [Candidatus Adiutrix sp.]